LILQISYRIPPGPPDSGHIKGPKKIVHTALPHEEQIRLFSLLMLVLLHRLIPIISGDR